MRRGRTATALVVDQKVEELIALLHSEEIDPQGKKQIHKRLSQELDEQGTAFREFRNLNISSGSSRVELADDLEFLLSKYQLDSKLSKRFLFMEQVKRLSLLLVSVLLIIMGFGMIFIPAPPYFELFTIYYFTWDDGITLMDVISLIIVFSGTFLMISTLVNLTKADSL